MTKQNDNTETVEIRLVVKGRPDEMKILAAKWLRSNKFEALDFLAQGRKPEIIADNDATPHQIHGAKVESAAFYRYLAEALSTQIAIERGELPAVADAPLISQVPTFTIAPPLLPSPLVVLPEPLAPEPKQSPPPEDEDDDWDDDDFEMTITLPAGCK
jgi:hypothetical protein